MSTLIPEGYMENWEPGARPFFEYQCEESHESADAQLWYHSHQQVTVLRRNVEDEIANGVEGLSFYDRAIECAVPANYTIRTGDGLEWCAMEDELLTGPEFYERADPPIDPNTL